MMGGTVQTNVHKHVLLLLGELCVIVLTVLCCLQLPRWVYSHLADYDNVIYTVICTLIHLSYIKVQQPRIPCRARSKIPITLGTGDVRMRGVHLDFARCW